jgi:hypothetical protein
LLGALAADSSHKPVREVVAVKKASR